MLAHTIVLAVGLLACLIGFVQSFELNEGSGPSNLNPAIKRRLMALWTVTAIDLVVVAGLFLVKPGLTWRVELVPIGGIALTAVGLVQLRGIAATASDAAAAVLTKFERWVMLGLYLAVSACLIYVLVQLPDQQALEPRISLGITFLILFIAITATSLVYFFIKEKPDSLANDTDPMPIITRRVLALYLLAIGTALGALLWRIGSIDFSEAGLSFDIEELRQNTAGSALASETNSTITSNTPQLSGGTGTETQDPPLSSSVAATTSNAAQPVGPSTASTVPVLYRIYHQETAAAAPVVYITAYGDHFSADSRIRFSQQEQPTVFIDPSRIQAQLDQTTTNTLSPILVDVITNKHVTQAFAITVTKAHIHQRVLGMDLELTRELQLLLLAILAGALGSFIHALKSFGDFTGNGTLTARWFWWYITRPFLGAALAIVFYAVLRGGFMTGTTADVKSVSQFGVIAIGALVGMFADKASDKLAEIFDTLFKGEDTRSGKLAAPIIDRLDPATILHGTNPPPGLRIIGDRLSTVTQVKFGTAVHDHGAVSQKEIVVQLAAQDIANPGTIKVSVHGDNGDSPTKDLQIT